MDSSFTPIEQMLKFRASRHEDFPYQEILLTLPPQHNCLHQLWSALSTTEKDQLEQITRKLLSRLDQMEQDGVVLEAMS